MAASMKQVNFLYKNCRFTLAVDDVIADRLFKEANYLNEFFKNLIGTDIWPSLGLPNDLNIEDIKLIEDKSNIENDTGKDQNYSTKKRDVWTDAIIKLLISERLALEEQFGKPGNKKKLWMKIHSKLVSQGYNLTAEDCDMKWRNLIATYRKNKDRARKSGEGCITWPYFQVLDEKYGYKTNISPPAETLLSSLPSPIYSQPSPIDTSNSSENSTATTSHNSSENSTATTSHNSSSSSPIPHQSDTPYSKKPKLSKEEPPAWFQNYVENKKKEDKEKEEREERRWREFQKMEEEKLKVMKNLHVNYI
ncbi:uncharacterized protein LOC111636531 [Centruroides sculpturatus]|uniref:uncharacterized protein LOC111636531 n=1 Tax=Centruroides sculpturatus TaxID=218467 RepID=UPI000C6CBF6C|nr:uncharacterized protein LOC111636531 [Centruroides sculpturatus]